MKLVNMQLLSLNLSACKQHYYHKLLRIILSNHNSNNQIKLTDSPCVRNCCLDSDDMCLGCFRYIDEITSWRSYSDEEKQKITILCQQRQEDEQSKLNS